MNQRKMRRVCAELLGSLQLSVPTEAGTLFTALCDAAAKRHDRPVEHRLVPFPPRTVSGLWVATPDRHLVLIEAGTAPDHQLVILGHELWHLECDAAHIEPVDSQEVSALLAPTIDANTVQNMATRAAARTDCSLSEEVACELFGSMLGSKGLPWLEGCGTAVTTSAAAMVHRVHASLEAHGHLGSGA